MGPLCGRNAPRLPVDRRAGPLRADRPPGALRLQLPGDPDLLPPPDAIVVAPATSNTINKWAAGISDTLALGLLCEAIGMELPVVVLPYLNAAQGKHPALAESIKRLRDSGVRVLFGPDVLPLHRPREGRREQFPWHLTLAALDSAG